MDQGKITTKTCREQDKKSESKAQLLRQDDRWASKLHESPLLSNPTQSFQRAEEEISTMAVNAVNAVNPTPLRLPSAIPTGKWISNARVCLPRKPPTQSTSSFNKSFRSCSNFSLKPSSSSSLASGNGMSIFCFLLLLMLMVGKNCGMILEFLYKGLGLGFHSFMKRNFGNCSKSTF